MLQKMDFNQKMTNRRVSGRPVMTTIIARQLQLKSHMRDPFSAQL